MRTAFLVALATIIASIAMRPAEALCFYSKADFYAGKSRSYTTIPQEFHDSKWVVKAKVDLIDDHWANAGESWSIYTVRILTRFKGPNARTLRIFTFRDSGGFYLSGGKNEGVDSDWLLFLDPPTQTRPRGVTNVVQVNFNCGQSRLWSDVATVDRRLLDSLAKR